MQVNPDTLTTVQKFRVQADPIVGSEHAAGAAALEDAIYTERANLIDDTPAGERITIAAWGELAVLCSTASLTHAAFTNEGFVRLFELALRNTMSSMVDSEEDVDAILPSNSPSISPTEQTRERAYALREAIKRDRDRWFKDAVDDLEVDTDGVPTAFWLGGETNTTASEQLAAWYAAGDVSDQLINTLPSLPGQAANSGAASFDEARDETAPNRDTSQASLNMF